MRSSDSSVILTIAVAPCTHGDVRLVGVAKSREGLVEVCIDGRWGSVCLSDTSFNSAESAARVVCSQLGFPPSRGKFKVNDVSSIFLRITMYHVYLKHSRRD